MYRILDIGEMLCELVLTRSLAYCLYEGTLPKTLQGRCKERYRGH